MAPRAYEVVMHRSWAGWPIGVGAAPVAVGYDEVVERVLRAGVQVREPERLAVGSRSYSFAVRNHACLNPDAGGDDAGSFSVGTYTIVGLQIGELRRVCFGADRVLDIVRTH